MDLNLSQKRLVFVIVVVVRAPQDTLVALVFKSLRRDFDLPTLIYAFRAHGREGIAPGAPGISKLDRNGGPRAIRLRGEAPGDRSGRRALELCT